VCTGPHQGFTLLELLVVMFIVGIIAAMATLSVGVATSDKGIEKELERIEDLLALASDEAVLEGREYGLTFYAREYQFSAYDPAADRWTPLEPGSEPLSPRRFPEDAVVDLEIEDRLLKLREERPPPPPDATAEKRSVPRRTDDRGREQDEEPQVLILSSGDITPFELRLRPAIGSPGITLRVAENGDVDQVHDEP
jgi:general secretion pathway protein H